LSKTGLQQNAAENDYSVLDGRGFLCSGAYLGAGSYLVIDLATLWANAPRGIELFDEIT